MSTTHDQQTYAVELSEQQLHSVLWSLTMYEQETRTYISRISVSDTPEPTDLCCKQHRHRWEESKRQRDSLIQREAELGELIKRLEAIGSAGPSA